MSRSGYTDDCEHQGATNLFRANVRRALESPRGQAFLRELVEALDALPEKRLIALDLMCKEEGHPTPQVCALGAVGIKRGIDMTWPTIDPRNNYAIAQTFKISLIMVGEIEYMNDDAYYWTSPEQRWRKMREWAISHLKVAP